MYLSTIDVRRLALSLLLLVAVSGCANLKQIGQPQGSQYTTAGLTKNAVTKAGLDVLSWSVTPEKPSAGDSVSSNIRISAYPENNAKEMLVTVARILHIDGTPLPLGSPKTDVLAAGEQFIQGEFTLPVDADRGEYKLETRIVVGEYRETVKNRFIVY